MLKGWVGVGKNETTTGEGVGVGEGVNDGVGVSVGKGVKVGGWVGKGVAVGVAVKTITWSTVGVETTAILAADHEVTVVVLLKVAPARKGPKKVGIRSVLATKLLVKVNR
jgi:hypothetical protein